MATPTRNASRARSGAGQGRFGRSTAGRTASRGRTSAGRAGTTGRFNAPSAGRGVTIRRRKPQPKGVSKVMKSLGGALPKGGAAATAGKAGKPAGFALLAGAAGLAFKNRDKLGSLLGRGKQDHEQESVPFTEAAPPGGTQSMGTSSTGTGASAEGTGTGTGLPPVDATPGAPPLDTSPGITPETPDPLRPDRPGL
jgi:hypothetical protein